MTFSRGQQVVCIQDGWEPFPYEMSNVPYVKGVYTVRHITSYPDDAKNWLGRPIRTAMLEFDEIYFVGEIKKEFWPSFRSDFFRPVKTTSIDVFEQLRVNPPKELIKDKV